MLRIVVCSPAGYPIVINVAQSGLPASTRSLLGKVYAGHGPRSGPFCTFWQKLIMRRRLLFPLFPCITWDG